MGLIDKRSLQLAIVMGRDPDRVLPYPRLVSSTPVWDSTVAGKRPSPPPLPPGNLEDARSIARKIALRQPDPIIPDEE